jgi:4-azaleucine resistance transporter AzlC
MSTPSEDFKSGLSDISPMIVAYIPIAMLWGTLAASKGLSPLESLLTSAFVFGGASQFVAIEMWREPLPIILMVVTVFVVNLRHALMSASISRHLGGISSRWHPMMMYVLTDEAWAMAERKALARPLTLPYYLGVAAPLWPIWSGFTFIGAWLGAKLGNPAAIGLDFAFAAMFISILAGFWKGPRTGAVIIASAVVAIAAKTYLPGAWYIVSGGLAGAIVAAIFHSESEP